MSTETKTLEFEGYSDDTFGEYAVTKEDYDNCASGKPIVWRVDAGGESLLVIGQHEHVHDCAMGWRIGIQAVSEDGDDATPPNWNIRFVQSKCAYSPRLAMTVPVDFKLTCLSASEDEE